MREFSPQKCDAGMFASSPPDNLIFGNGVEIETKVWEKVVQEKVEKRGSRSIYALSRTHYVLPSRTITIIPALGTDLIQVHFTPLLSTGEKVNSPTMVPIAEKLPIALDCLDGFLSFAYALLANSIEVIDHDPKEELYLFAETHRSFAAFLRMRLGFRGTVAGNKAWTTQSDFTSDENMKYIHSQYAVLQNRIVY